ncbi:hypothetical protein A5730_05200 [Mycobacterium sp. ACS4054]|uniref:TPM domain-containing protein n=1 Tax=Mycobacterium sp. ACS4054 TaxID=1834119 RepID=UPI0007FD2274|nr:TPM domain-containing protein [Mycobacterium sp. ACS4054]OBF12265.1 hypothetical protein A5730_05200 [Mycobacterium sp. ACS4054]
MRVVRLVGVILTILAVGLPVANPAAAQPPSKLTDHITDNTGALTDADRAAVSSAIDRLYHDQHIWLWVVYVDNFNRYKPDNWAERTRSESRLGDQDALLAVATNTKLYTFTVPPRSLTATESSDLQRSKIDPAVATKNWAGAAVAAADGLDKSAKLPEPPSSSKRPWLPIVIGGVAVVVVAALLLVYVARRQRRRAAVSAGHGSIDGQSLAQALATADARMRQISDYVTSHRQSIGTKAQARLEDAKGHLAAAHAHEASNAADAIAYANRASTLAAEAQSLANADVLAAHRPQRRRA